MTKRQAMEIEAQTFQLHDEKFSMWFKIHVSI